MNHSQPKKNSKKKQNTDEHVIANIIKLLDLPNAKTNKSKWMITGKYVLYLYQTQILKNIISPEYPEPEFIDLVVKDSLYKKILQNDTISKLTNTQEILIPLSGKHVLNIISEKNSVVKLSNADKYVNFYIANINDILFDIQTSLTKTVNKLYDTFRDIDYISKIILFKEAINSDQLPIVDVVNKLQSHSRKTLK